MKKVLLTIGICLLISVGAFAQQRQQQPPVRNNRNLTERVDRIARQLDLTKEQRNELYDFYNMKEQETQKQKQQDENKLKSILGDDKYNDLKSNSRRPGERRRIMDLTPSEKAAKLTKELNLTEKQRMELVKEFEQMEADRQEYLRNIERDRNDIRQNRDTRREERAKVRELHQKEMERILGKDKYEEYRNLYSNRYFGNGMLSNNNVIDKIVDEISGYRNLTEEQSFELREYYRDLIEKQEQNFYSFMDMLMDKEGDFNEFLKYHERKMRDIFEDYDSKNNDDDNSYHDDIYDNEVGLATNISL